MKLFNIRKDNISDRFNTPALVLNGKKRIHVPIENFENLNSENFKIVSDTVGPKIVTSNYKATNEPDYITRINCKGQFKIGSYGTAYVLSNNADNVRIITYGYELCENEERDYGLYFDWLVTVKSPAVVYVKPCSHSIKHGNTYFIIFNEDKAEIVYAKSINQYKNANNMQFSTNLHEYVDFGTLKQPQLY